MALVREYGDIIIVSWIPGPGSGYLDSVRRFRLKNSLWAIQINIECSTWCFTLLFGSPRFISYDRQSAGLRLYLYRFQHRRGILNKTWPISMDGMVNVLSEDALSSKWPVGPEAKSHTDEPEMSTLWWILQSLDFLNKGNLLFAKGI